MNMHDDVKTESVRREKPRIRQTQSDQASIPHLWVSHEVWRLTRPEDHADRR